MNTRTRTLPASHDRTTKLSRVSYTRANPHIHSSPDFQLPKHPSLLIYSQPLLDHMPQLPICHMTPTNRDPPNPLLPVLRCPIKQANISNIGFGPTATKDGGQFGNFTAQGPRSGVSKVLLLGFLPTPPRNRYHIIFARGRVQQLRSSFQV